MRKWFLWIGIPLAVIAVTAAIFYQGMYGRAQSIGIVKEVFSIQRGEGVREIAEHLEEAGLIRNRVFFIAYAVLTDSQNTLKAGRYFHESGMSIQEITRKISRGDTDSLTMQIIEGWNISDIAEYLNARGIVGEDEFYAFVDAQVGESFSKQFSILEDKTADISLEGYLFPDTYRFFKDSSVDEILRKMLDNFEAKFAELQPQAEQLEYSIHELVTLASIIQAEVRGEDEMLAIGGIFHNRL